MLLGRSTLLDYLGMYYIQGRLSRRYATALADRAFVLITGVIWVILMVVVEEYFRRGVQKGDLYRRIGRVFAPILFFVLVADLALAFLIGFENVHWLRLLLLVVELLTGIGFFWLSKNGPLFEKTTPKMIPE